VSTIAEPERYRAYWHAHWSRVAPGDPARAAGRITYGTEEVAAVSEDAIRELELCGDDVFLDLGCARGLMREYLEPKVRRYFGLDYIPAMRPAVIGLAQRLPFRDATFDKVLMAGVLVCIHPEDYRQIFGEIRRVTKPIGRAMIASNPFEFSSEMAHVFSFESLSALARECGWTEARQTPISPLVEQVHGYFDMVIQ